MSEEPPWGRIKGVRAVCKGCGLDNYVPIELCTLSGVVRCPYCDHVIKRDVTRRGWRR